MQTKLLQPLYYDHFSFFFIGYCFIGLCQLFYNAQLIVVVKKN